MKCPKCDRAFESYNGLTTHLARTHDIKREEAYVLVNLGGVFPLCAYDGCSERPKFRGNSRGYQRFCTGHRGKWQEGLTAQNDDRIAQRGKKISKAQLAGQHWSNDEETKERVSDKISYTRSCNKIHKVEKYPGLSKGYGWSKGLTKETDPRLKAIGDALLLSRDEIECRFTHISGFTLIDEISDETRQSEKLQVCCDACGALVKKSLWGLEHGCVGCPECSMTAPHRLIKSFVEDVGFECEMTRDVISPFEIDIWVSDVNLAIEHNGLYFHSEFCKGHNKAKHQLKTDMCAAKGITLLHFFEDELMFKSDIVRSMILNRLGRVKKRVYARKCRLIDVSRDDAVSFFNANHLDGYSNSCATFGLIADDKIVSAISLRKPFLGKNPAGSIEVCRFVSQLDTVVVGGLSKLLSYVKSWCVLNGYDRIVTYADQRWGKSHAYSSVGFEHNGETAQMFWWTNLSKRFHRLKYRARDGKSEREIAAEAGVAKIWGCRNSRYVMEL